MTVPRVLLIACGSFSPLTPMHLRMFEIARDYLQDECKLEVVGGVISPVHDSYGKKGLVSANHRCTMVKLALQTSDWIRLSDWEVNQQEWSPTRTTLRYHQNFINNYLNDPNDNEAVLPGWVPGGIKNRKEKIEVKLLCGADLLESFSSPVWSHEDVEDIVSNYGLVVISRSGSNPEKFIFESDLLTLYKSKIDIVTNWVPNEVSSTMIRRLLSRGQSVKYLIDDLVIEYIKMHELFDVNTTKYIISPHDNQMIVNQNYLNDQYMNKINLINDNESGEYDEMDETDTNSSKRSILSVSLDKVRPKVFCCGTEGMKVKTVLSRPGQAVQVITNSPSRHEDDNSEVRIETEDEHVKHDDVAKKYLKIAREIVTRDLDDKNYMKFIKKCVQENRLKSNNLPYH